MYRYLFCLLLPFVLLFHEVHTQENQNELSIELIMQGKDFTGYWPHNVFWDDNSETIYFKWNPEKTLSDSSYKVNLNHKNPIKTTLKDRMYFSDDFSYNKLKTFKVFSKNGDLYLKDIKKNSIRQITSTVDFEESPSFNYNEDKIAYYNNSNLFTWNIHTGEIKQVTNFINEIAPAQDESEEKTWLEKDQLKNFEVLNVKYIEEELNSKNKTKLELKHPKAVYLEEWDVVDFQLSPDEKFVYYQIYKDPDNIEYTKVPNFVTFNGYTEIISARPKVGSPNTEYKSMIYNVEKDSCYDINYGNLPGIYENPFSENELDTTRKVLIGFPIWNNSGTTSICEIRSLDNKDRWIAQTDYKSGELHSLEHQHDDAWINGPGINYLFTGGNIGWMNDNNSFWFFSEETTYSNLYKYDIKAKQKTALISGNFEIFNLKYSKNGNYFYFVASIKDPGIRELYRLNIKSNKIEQLSSYNGCVEYYLAPDEKHIAIRASKSNKPWELFLMVNKPKENLIKLTKSTTPKFELYNWIIPEFIKIKATDGEEVPARLYKPKKEQSNGAGIIFVHGAGYLQNAHQWWSHYYREYMFHNFLVEKGYTILDIDYRGSAGYGRDWRTAIYRNMGDKDLSDQVDGTKYMINNLDIDSSRIGIYGGSYGGFITLMAMFKHPEIFKSGAALRAVTDWAHYNHPYTSNILNTPENDSTAYYRSSPIYYAQGLEGKLLICHGMIDDNVQYQDVVRLAQRLIELGKENWELAVYPMEGHSFQETSSWTDEYKRIYKLFSETLLKE